MNKTYPHKFSITVGGFVAKFWDLPFSCFVNSERGIVPIVIFLEQW